MLDRYSTFEVPSGSMCSQDAMVTSVLPISCIRTTRYALRKRSRVIDVQAHAAHCRMTKYTLQIGYFQNSMWCFDATTPSYINVQVSKSKNTHRRFNHARISRTLQQLCSARTDYGDASALCTRLSKYQTLQYSCPPFPTLLLPASLLKTTFAEHRVYCAAASTFVGGVFHDS